MSIKMFSDSTSPHGPRALDSLTSLPRRFPRLLVGLAVILTVFFLTFHGLGTGRELGSKKYNNIPNTPNAEADVISPVRNDPIIQSSILAPPAKIEGANDVLLMVKTGSTEIFKRLPAILSVLQSNYVPNLVFYSDAETVVQGYHVINVLANASDALQQHDQFRLYRQLQKLKGKDMPFEDEDSNLRGGWELDKFKNIRAYAHAYRNWPNKKWYVLIDADTYLHWHNLNRWLLTLDSNKSLYLGSNWYLGKTLFAQGGAGVVFSHKAMLQTFAADQDLENKFDDRSLEICCGDALFAEVVKTKGIPVSDMNKDAFQTNGPFKTHFWPNDWCMPVMTFHRNTNEEMAKLNHLEQSIMKYNPNRSVYYADVWRAIIDPHLQEEREKWDNNPNNNNNGIAHTREEIGKEINIENIPQGEREKKLREACKAKCEKWDECYQWQMNDKTCFLGKFLCGGIKNDNDKFYAGFNLENIRKMRQGTKCDSINKESFSD